jgi:PiT family inorganic phosphate transporter
LTFLVYLSSGLFLGWSLGANDAANVFGTAVGSRMIRFTTAATICSVFVILGAVESGAGAAHGLGNLGAVNALQGSFIVALTAALTVYWMTKAGIPVSITQAIVGAIIGWNLFSHSITDTGTLARIAATWVACPILGALFAAFLYRFTAAILGRFRLHLLRLDSYTRWGLVLAGAAGSYSLGANNIGNVMGVFVPSSPLADARFGNLFTLTAVQQLFLLGAIAIAVGVFTYSKRVMMTVGTEIMSLTPLGAWVVVVSHSIVLFLFSSTALEHELLRLGLPTIPLIPVSSSQVVVGAIIGIGLLRGIKGARQIRWRVITNIASGWVATPVIAAVVSFVLLFIMQNVFQQKVYHDVTYVLSDAVLDRIERRGIATDAMRELKDREVAHGRDFRNALREKIRLDGEEEKFVIFSAEIFPTFIDPVKLETLSHQNMTTRQVEALESIAGKSFDHKWQLAEALSSATGSWKMREGSRLDKAYNKILEERLNYLYRTFLKENRDRSDFTPASRGLSAHSHLGSS